MRALLLRLMTGALFFAIASSALDPSVGAAAEKTAVAKRRALPTETKAWTGDFDGMLKRRHLRVLVPYSRSLYFNDKGRERGLTADLVRDFERYLNQKYAKQLGKRPITVYIVPTTRDELLKDVADGFGDIAAGNLTVTEERRSAGRLRRAGRPEAGVRAGADRAEVAGRSRRPTISRARPCTSGRRRATTRASPR